MSHQSEWSHEYLESRLKEILKEHQRDGLSMIGNADRLVGRLVHAFHEWEADLRAAQKKSA